MTTNCILVALFIFECMKAAFAFMLFEVVIERLGKLEEQNAKLHRD